ncbi:MAG: polysaccharide biosynthesis protein [Armatimonadetes bacterium]|nr:polysaccharide biosynthesis protein [Armatimonadota bacterium]
MNSKRKALMVLDHALRRSPSRWLSFAGAVLVDFLIIIIAMAFSGLASFQGSPAAVVSILGYYSVPMAFVAALTLFAAGFYWISERYFNIDDLVRLAASSAFFSVCLFGLTLGYGPLKGHTHFDFTLLFLFFSFSLIAGTRVFRRVQSWNRAASRRRVSKPAVRTLVIGAGDAGETLLREVMRARKHRYDIVGLVDDDPQKTNLRIYGSRVLGTTEDIPHIARTLGIEEALIAIPSLDGRNIRRIFDLCRQCNVRVKTLPGVSNLLVGANADLSAQLRTVEIEDLLRRKVLRADVNDIAGYLRDESVLITGAGGSIGGELARQIASLPPHNLCLLGRGENSIYEIQMELASTYGRRCDAVVADVRSMPALERVFRQVQPTVLFHAAAHKHVPLMQANPIEAIENNVLGTWNLIQLSLQADLRKFILVSTDKAVNPSSVMGATKRVCELMVQAYAREYKTQFGAVRFGNVLGSRGSLIPVLKEQIRRGGPVTITHPDMERYFMTIPEAVQLILQAGAMGKDGEVFILDMGEPIRIMDLAYDLISLHGLVPEKDIEVSITGMRPGEKLHEELTYSKEELSPTKHPKISIVPGEQLSISELDAAVGELMKKCKAGDEKGAFDLLMDIVKTKPLPEEQAAH